MNHYQSIILSFILVFCKLEANIENLDYDFFSKKNFIKPNIETMTLDEKIAQMIMIRI